MGPGVVGTGTALGTTALEQAPILDGANALGARSMAVPRISFADPRPRHQGLSHHSLTALGLPDPQLHYHHPSGLERDADPDHYCSMPRSSADPETQIAMGRHRRRKPVVDRSRSPSDLNGTNPSTGSAFFATGAAAGQAAARWAMSRKHI